MKRNDIGDSYLLWLFERVLATRGVITPPHARKHSAQPSRMPARQPLEMPSRYRFHSTRPAPWKRVKLVWRRASTAVQGRSELQPHDTTVLQCLAVEVRNGLGRSPVGPHAVGARLRDHAGLSITCPI